MTDEWEPLPKRRKQKSYRQYPVIAENAPQPPEQQQQQQEPQQPNHLEEEASAETPQLTRRAAPDKSQMQRVTAAVEERAAQHRPDRGEGMGNDGVAGEFYEYLDHTADVQLHAWGKNLKEAFEHIVPCMLNYMTDLSKVEVDPRLTQTFEVEGHDLSSLLFAWLDEVLFRFSSEAFVCKSVTILTFERPAAVMIGSAKDTPVGIAKVEGGERQGKYKIKVRAEGETFSLAKHPQGTEVKAITYSAMQIHEMEHRTDLYVIIDI
ncbi:hypothetical protein VYU27_005535 [Nannochloropsis oceanica]